jgi:hypothetical protein
LDDFFKKKYLDIYLLFAQIVGRFVGDDVAVEGSSTLS